MHPFLAQIIKFLSHTITVHVYSQPGFAMEICMSILMCVVHFLLIIDVNNNIRKLNVPPIRIKAKPSISLMSKFNLISPISCTHKIDSHCNV